MEKMLIFAGTSEGRLLAEHLAGLGIQVHICVATEYGEEILKQISGLVVHQGRLTREEMEVLLGQQEWKAVVDATHPYAIDVSKNIKAACERTGRNYLRLLRDLTIESKEAGVIYVNSKEEAAGLLNSGTGNILFTTGSKELKDYVTLISDKDRIYARILSNAAMVEECSRLGLLGKQIICMQGPFTAQLNAAMLMQLKAEWLVTKDTGAAGGFPEKRKGARLAGAKVIVLKRPSEEEGMTEEEVLKSLELPLREAVFPQEENRRPMKEEHAHIPSPKGLALCPGWRFGNPTP